MKDYRDLPLTGANDTALPHFEAALSGFHCYAGDPVAAVDRALAAAPEFVMAHVLKADLMLSSTEQPGVTAAADIVAAARNLPASDREQRHLGAIEALASGNFVEGSGRLDAILIDHPRDVLALQMAHLFDFVQGDARNMRDRPARVQLAWSPSLPGYHAVLAMQAFGHEECGEYLSAEARGREALEINPKDAWAHHAVAHVYEMQGRAEDGLRWMHAREPHWSVDNLMAVHNWWHTALFHLELDAVDNVLALYDERIRAGKSVVVLDLIDASAMLWRLKLRGVDVGNRWTELADAWTQHLQDDYYAFNNWHALLAMAGAERWQEADALIELMKARIAKPGDNAAMLVTAGLPVARAYLAFARSEYSQCISILESARSQSFRCGGSHAQRDLIDLTLIEAARRERLTARVYSLAAERLKRKPASALAQRYAQGALA